MNRSILVNAIALLYLFCELSFAFSEGDKMAESLVDSFELSHEEKIYLKKKASEGDAESSFKLANYYEYVKLDHKEAMKWFEKSAKSGNIIAQYNFGFFLMHSQEKKTKSVLSTGLNLRLALGN